MNQKSAGSQCLEVEELLSTKAPFEATSLPRALASHVETCASCQALVAFEKELPARLDEALPAPPDRVWKQIRTTIDDGIELEPAGSSIFRWLFWPALAASMAAIALFAFLPRQQQAVIASLSGTEVSLKVGDRTIQAVVGAEVPYGARVITGRSSRCRLRVGRADVEVGPAATLWTIAPDETSVEAGRVDFQVARTQDGKKVGSGSRFAVRLPSALVEVLGTIFFVDVQASKGTVGLVEGRVKLSGDSGSSLTMEPGQEAEFEAGHVKLREAGSIASTRPPVAASTGASPLPAVTETPRPGATDLPPVPANDNRSGGQRVTGGF